MVAGKSISKTRSVRSQLGEVAMHLRQVQSAVVVAVAALKQQNCELDADIARSCSAVSLTASRTRSSDWSP